MESDMATGIALLIFPKLFIDMSPWLRIKEHIRDYIDSTTNGAPVHPKWCLGKPNTDRQ